MKKFIISEQENGMKLENYMKKVLSNAPLSFIYKVLRKKDAKVNGHWQDGKYVLSTNDEVKVDENGQIHVAKENVETFTKEINELLESKVELNAEKIKLNDLNCDVSSQMMINLMPFIEIEE